MSEIQRYKDLLVLEIHKLVYREDDSQIHHAMSRIDDLLELIIKYSSRTGTKGDNMEFEIYTKEVNLEDGRKFNTYSAIERHFDGSKKYYEVKFTKEVTELPSQHCIVVVDSWRDWNFDCKGEYPCIWIKAVKEIRNL